jgi:hypothetical protein
VNELERSIPPSQTGDPIGESEAAVFVPGSLSEVERAELLAGLIARFGRIDEWH